MKSIIHFNPISELQKHINLNLEFDNLIDLIITNDIAQIHACINKVWSYSLQGKWCVGFLSYEAAPAFDKAYRTSTISNAASDEDIPLLQFAVYDSYKIKHFPEKNYNNSLNLNFKLDEEKYTRDFNKIIELIKNGDIYQINYTHQLKQALDYKISHNEWINHYYKLLLRQINSYSIYLNWFDKQKNLEHNLLSFSPELFFHWQPQSGKIITQPMKGTAKRNVNNPDIDLEIMHKLKLTLKEQAENIMIVDLIRNDLSKIAKLGSVKTNNIFECIKLQSIWQMVSTVSAVTKNDVTLYDILCALFPCGSITGAPKIQSMKVIHALEQEARGVYCGIAGLIKPFGETIFNVAIRSLYTVTNKNSNHTNISYGVGSGITIDAVCEQEIKELYSKFVFLNN